MRRFTYIFLLILVFFSGVFVGQIFNSDTQSDENLLSDLQMQEDLDVPPHLFDEHLKLPGQPLDDIALENRRNEEGQAAIPLGDIRTREKIGQELEESLMEAGVAPADIDAMVEDITRMIPNQREERPAQLAVKP